MAVDSSWPPSLDFELPDSPDADIPPRNLWVELVSVPVRGPDSVQQRVLVAPDPVVMYEQQVVRWYSYHPFSILYTGRIPIEAPQRADVQIQARPDGEGYVAEARIRHDAGSTKSFKYTVAVYDAERDRVYMADPEDPVEKDPRRRP